MNIPKSLHKLPLFSIALWSVVIVLLTLFISSVNYTFHDPDSQIYSKLGQELSATPLKSWLAPRWVAYSGLEGYFHEHPSGVLWVNATLIKFGAPAAQAAAIANFLYFLITFLFVFKLGQSFKDRVTGWAMVWAVLLMPISIQYILRGNLEPPLTMSIIIGMYCICRTNDGWRYRIGFALALIMAVFFKGMQGAYVGLVGGLFWLIAARDKSRFFTLLGSAITLITVMGLYEWLYRMQTGEEFWLLNFKIQAVGAVESNSIWQKPYNFIWYMARAIYFALPWSIFLLAGLRSTKERLLFPRDKRWWWLLSSTAALILIMSLFDRRADRYIFPGYTLIAVAGGWYLSERFTNIRNWLSANSKAMQIVFAAALITVAVLKVFASMYFYSNVQIWRF